MTTASSHLQNAAVAVLDCSPGTDEFLRTTINHIAGAFCLGIAGNMGRLTRMASTGANLRLFMLEVCPGQRQVIDHVAQLRQAFPGIPVLLYSRKAAASTSLIMEALAAGAGDSLSLPEAHDSA